MISSKPSYLVLPLLPILLGCVLLVGCADTAPEERGDALLTNADILHMAESGLSDEVIRIAIQTTDKVQLEVDPAALVALREGGVSDAVIQAMQWRAASPEQIVDAAPTYQPTAPPPTLAPPPPVEPAAPPPPREEIEESFPRLDRLPPPPPPSPTLTIPRRTRLDVVLVEELGSAISRVGEAIELRAARAVEVDGETVIAEGAAVRGRVLKAKPKRRFGRRGKLEFSVDMVEAVDGREIVLSTKLGLRRGDMPPGGEGDAGGGFVDQVFSFFAKGREVSIPAGTEYTLYIDGEPAVRVR